LTFEAPRPIVGASVFALCLVQRVEFIAVVLSVYRQARRVLLASIVKLPGMRIGKLLSILIRQRTFQALVRPLVKVGIVVASAKRVALRSRISSHAIVVHRVGSPEFNSLLAKLVTVSLVNGRSITAAFDPLLVLLGRACVFGLPVRKQNRHLLLRNQVLLNSVLVKIILPLRGDKVLVFETSSIQTLSLDTASIVHTPCRRAIGH